MIPPNNPLNNNGGEQNFLIAVVLTLAILLGYQFFVVAPDAERRKAAMEAERVRIAEEAERNGTGEAVDGSTPRIGERPRASSILPASREAALAIGKRVTIQNEAVTGSINLEGSRFSDLRLTQYRQELDKSSDDVVLFSPRTTDNAVYEVIFGWTSESLNTHLAHPLTAWELGGGASRLTPETPIFLTHTSPQGLKFERRISIDDQYLFTIEDTVINIGDTAVDIKQVSTIRRDFEKRQRNTQGMAMSHRGAIGILDGILEKEKARRMIKGEALNKTTTGGWLGYTDKYWLSALIPAQNETYMASYSNHLSQGRQELRMQLAGDTVFLQPGQTHTASMNLFAGAKQVAALTDYEKSLEVPRLSSAVDWGFLWFLTRPFFSGLMFFSNIFGGIGLGILMLTIVIKTLTLPLVYSSYQSMARMRDLTPKMQEIRERFEDRQRQQQEIMALYRKEKVNPVSGCLPILLQLPIFFALYSVLMVTIELRHQPFFGWIQDMSAPDPLNVYNLFGLLPYDPTAIPVIGTFLFLGAWPIMYGLTMWALQALNPPPTDPTQRMIFGLMPIVFTFIFAGFAAGLVIYWTWSNVITMVQQYMIMRSMGKETELDKLVKRLMGGRSKPG